MERRKSLRSQKKRRLGFLTVLGLGLVLSYQNCSSGEYGLYGGGSNLPYFCSDEFVCDQQPDHLWVEGELGYTVYVKPHEALAVVQGECNAAGFPQNVIQYQVRAAGALVQQGETECTPQATYRFQVNLCNGISAAGCPAHLAKELRVALQIFGIDEKGHPYENVRFGGEANFPLNVITAQTQ